MAFQAAIALTELVVLVRAAARAIGVAPMIEIFLEAAEAGVIPVIEITDAMKATLPATTKFVRRPSRMCEFDMLIGPSIDGV